MASARPPDRPTARLPPRRLRLTLAYDGAEFYGAQAQPGRRTVAGVLEGALARVTGADARVVFAGRTDRGVHATGQVAHCDAVTRLDDGGLRRALNAVLPADLAVLAVEIVGGLVLQLRRDEALAVVVPVGVDAHQQVGLVPIDRITED